MAVWNRIVLLVSGLQVCAHAEKRKGAHGRRHHGQNARPCAGKAASTERFGVLGTAPATVHRGGQTTSGAVMIWVVVDGPLVNGLHVTDAVLRAGSTEMCRVRAMSKSAALSLGQRLGKPAWTPLAVSGSR